MIELIPATDVVGWHTKRGVNAKKDRDLPKRRFNKPRLNTPITNDNIETFEGGKRKRCFICGHYEGQWCEIFEHGKWRYHYLCNECKKPTNKQ